MSTQITVAFTKQYHSNCEQVVQQVESRARERMEIKNMTGAAKDFMEYLGKATVFQRTVRHGDTQTSDTPHYRRMVTTLPWYAADYIDKPDLARTLIDPQSAYLTAFRAGHNRKIDSLAFIAARGIAYTGEEGTTEVALPSGQKVASGSQGLTVLKLINASEILNLADVPSEEEGGPMYTRWLFLGPKQVSDLLKEVEVGSADYNLVKPLTEGKVTRFMGFNFVPTNQLYSDGTDRYCLAWVKAGMGMGLSYDINATVDRVPTKQNSILVQMEMMYGFARLQEELVVEIACTE